MIVHESVVVILELTVCHETNMQKSKQYKLNKYANIAKSLKGRPRPVKTFTFEVSTLGFAADLTEFISISKLPSLPKLMLTRIADIALNHSYEIYRCRNAA